MSEPEETATPDRDSDTGEEESSWSAEKKRLPEQRVCDECGRWIDRREILYRMKIELFAEEKVDLDSDQGSGFQKADSLEELIDILEQMSEEEAEEATAQVYEKYEFALCSECRKDYHGKFRHRDRISEG